MESDDEAFMRAVQAAPEDEAVKLVYADWLDERDDIRGEFIRLEHQLAHLPERLNQLEEQIDSYWLKFVSRRRTKKGNGFLTADWLWDVMAEAQQDREKLRPILEAMTEERLEEFYYEYWNAAFELYPSHYCSERHLDADHFLDVGEWVVAQGRELYEAIWANPKIIPHPYTIISLGYVGLTMDVFYERFGRYPER